MDILRESINNRSERSRIIRLKIYEVFFFFQSGKIAFKTLEVKLMGTIGSELWPWR